jgi:DNA-binding SARP family transcriptional activator
MPLQITLFGHLQARDGSRVLTATLRPRGQRLLAYLLLRRNAPLPRQTLAFTLWPDEPEEEALGLLRRALSEVRTVLPANETWITATRDMVAWNPHSLAWIDIAVYEQQVRETDLAVLRAVADLYQADLLTGMDEEWIVSERERFRQMQLNLLRLLAGYHRAQNDFATALTLSRRAQILDPFAEAISRDLITLHALAGDRAAALAEYKRLRTLLDRELGVDPMEETETLVAAIIRGDALDWIESSGPAALVVQPGEIPFRTVGREAELSKLLQQWESVARGNGAIAIVSGEAGIGKTHLARELGRQVSRRGGLALSGHCFEFEAVIPYQAIVELLRKAAAHIGKSDLAPAHRSILARLLPDLFESAGDSGIGFTADMLRVQLFEALLQAFVGIGRRQPLLLIVEDVHWADQATLDWLMYIASRLRDARVMTLITYRTEEVSGQHALVRLVQRAQAAGTITETALQPLSRQANRELVAILSGLDQQDALVVADQLFDDTGGNPFFLHEVVRGLIEAGKITVSNERWSGAFVEAAPNAEVPLPQSLRAAINVRVERLDEMARAFLQAAAVAGRTFRYDVNQRAGGWADVQALAALETLLGRGFIRESDQSGTYSFAHHLVQELIYAGLTVPRRTFWHRQFVDALQALQPHDFESLAYHAEKAGNLDVARLYHVQAGDRHRELVALKDASDHYRAALQWWPVSDPAGRAAALHKLGQCQWVLMETQNALASFGEACGLYGQLEEWVQCGDLERWMGRMYWELGDTDAAWTHYSQALAILEGVPETIELARVVSHISQIYMVNDDYGEAIRWGRRALDLAERLEADDVAIHALNNLGVATAHRTWQEKERGLQMLQESLRRALIGGMPHDACRAYYNLSLVWMSFDKYDEAQKNLRELFEYASRIRAQAFIGAALSFRSELEWLTGQWKAALARQPQIVQEARTRWIIMASAQRGLIENDLGRAQFARLGLEQTLPKALNWGWGELELILPHLGELLRAYDELGDEMAAAEIAGQILFRIENRLYLPPCSVTPLLIAFKWYTAHSGSHPGTGTAANKCLAGLERAFQQLHSTQCGASLAEAQAFALLAEGNAAQAVDCFVQAAAGWADIPRPYDQARSLASLGEAFHRMGDPETARNAFRQALAILHTLASQLADDELRHSFLSSSLVAKCAGEVAGLL